MTQEREKKPLEEKIDDNLRKVYLLRVEEKIPDRFAELLRKLRAEDRSE